MNKKILMVLFPIVLAGLVSTTGCYRKSPEQRAQGIVKSIAEKLDLNDTQKARLDAMKQEFMAKAPAMKKTREETFDQLISLMTASSLDQARISSLDEQNKAQANELIGFLFSKYTEFHDMLSPEQRQKAAAEMERWREQYRKYNKE